MSRYLLATADESFEQRVRTALGMANGDLRLLSTSARVSPDHLVLDLSQIESTAEVVAVGPGLDTEDALSLVRRLGDERPEISVIIVAEPTAALWEQALQAGARAVLAPDANAPELLEVFSRAGTVARRLRQNLAAEEDSGPAARVIAVASPKGGTGKTTVAANLAVALAQVAPHEVVLMDGDLQFGDVAAALGLNPEHSIADAAAALPALDIMRLKVFLEPHASSLFALCGARSPVDGEQISASAVEQVLKLLAGAFRYVVVDTPAGLPEHTLSILERSTDMVQVCSMDVASLRAMSKEIEALDALGMTARRHLLLNRADSRVGMSMGDVEQALNSIVDVSIPSSRAVPLSLNEGTPIVLAEPASKVAREFTRLASRFATVNEAASRPAGRGFLRRNA